MAQKIQTLLKQTNGKKYIKALKGWDIEPELAIDEARPVFGMVELMSKKEVDEFFNDKYFGESNKKEYIVAPATKENMRKQVKFNLKYASYSDETMANIRKQGEELGVIR